MSENTNPIEAVRERLDGGRKWCKGAEHFQESACLIGAARDVMDLLGRVRNFYPHVEAAIREQFPDRKSASGLPPVADFNDHPQTEWADVDLVLDKAARAYDEAVR